MSPDNKLEELQIQAKFKQWLTGCLKMSHNDLIKDSSSIVTELYEFYIATCASEEAKGNVENKVSKIETMQNNILKINPTKISESLIKLASNRPRCNYYKPIDSYKAWELRESVMRKVEEEYKNEMKMFRCMEKKHLILHACELEQLKRFFDEVYNQLTTLPFSKEGLINMHYYDNLFGTVLESSTSITLGQLLEPAQLTNIVSHFPEIKPDICSNPLSAIHQKIEENYEQLIKEWLSMTPNQFKENVQWVRCVMDVYRLLIDDGYDRYYLSTLIKLKDPLTVVSKHWCVKMDNRKYDDTVFEECMRELESDLKENPKNYEMDNRFDIPISFKTDTGINSSSIKFNF